MKKWYNFKWFMWLTFILIITSPIGIILMWKNKHYNKGVRIFLTIVFAFILTVIFTPRENLKYDQTAKTNEATDEATEKVGESTKEIDTEAELIIKSINAYYENKDIMNVFLYAESISEKYHENEDIKEYVNTCLKDLCSQLSERKESLMGKMVANHDKIEGITYYKSQDAPEYINTNDLYAYIVTKEGFKPYLRFKIQYTSDDWLFINKYIINIDGENHEIIPEFGEVKRDNKTTVWEWIDKLASHNDIWMLYDIVNSEETIIRHQGDTKKHDRVVTKKEKNALSEVIELYVLFGAEALISD